MKDRLAGLEVDVDGLKEGGFKFLFLSTSCLSILLLRLGFSEGKKISDTTAKGPLAYIQLDKQNEPLKEALNVPLH